MEAQVHEATVRSEERRVQRERKFRGKLHRAHQHQRGHFAGTTGDGNLVRSLPDNRGSVSLFWSRERHDVALVTRLIGSYRDLAYQNVWDRGSDEVRALVSKQIDSYQSCDLQYSYAHDWSNSRLGSAVLTLGVLDLFNARIPYREIGDVSNDASVANYDASVFDARGRRLYARLLLQL